MRNIYQVVFFVFVLMSSSFSAFVSSVTIESSCPNSVTLSWLGTAGVGFNVYRSTTSFGTKSFVGSTNSLTKSRTDATAISGTTYYYWVEAVDNSQTYMSISWASTLVPNALPTPFSPSATKNGATIDLSWSYFNNEDGMYIYRSEDFGSYTFVKTITSYLTSTWTDYSVLPGHTYSYKISAYNECGESSLSYSSTYVNMPSLPDLMADSLSVVVSNDTLYGRFIVLNIGEQTASTFYATTTSNGSIVSSILTPSPLQSGYYYTFNFKFKASTSQNIIHVYADYINLITESNESNNELVLTKYALPTNPPLLSYPSNNAINMALSTSLLWYDPYGANSYRLQISTDNSFNVIISDVSNVSNTIYTINNLLTNTRYYWRVNSTNGGGISQWSSTYSFLTIPTAPALPQLLQPVDSSINISISPTLSWRANLNAITYYLQISEFENFSSCIINDSTITDTTKIVSSLSLKKKYYWRVNSKNAGGTSSWSQVWCFTTLPPITTAPVLTNPSNTAQDQPLSISFDWNILEDATSYGFQLSSDSLFSTILFTDSLLSTPSFLVSSLLANFKYYWRVNSKNFNGTSPWSSVWQFTTVPLKPSIPLLNYPTNRSIIVADSVLFIWHPSTLKVGKYTIEIGSDSLFSNILFADTAVADTLYLKKNLLNNSSYWWRVSAHNISGWSNYSLSSKFTVIIPATSVVPKDFFISKGLSISNACDFIYALPKNSDVVFEVYDIRGRILHRSKFIGQSAGYHHYYFNNQSMANGRYYLKFIAKDYKAIKVLNIYK